MKVAFFQQCGATAEYLAAIAKLGPLLLEIYTLHRGQLQPGAKAIRAETHLRIAQELQAYVKPTNEPGGDPK